MQVFWGGFLHLKLEAKTRRQALAQEKNKCRNFLVRFLLPAPHLLCNDDPDEEGEGKKPNRKQ